MQWSIYLVTTSSLFDMCPLSTRSNGVEINKIYTLHFRFAFYSQNCECMEWSAMWSSGEFQVNKFIQESCRQNI